MRLLTRSCITIVMTFLVLAGCAQNTARDDVLKATVTVATESEVKPTPLPAPVTAAPPPVTAASPTPTSATVRPASPAEQTKDSLGPKKSIETAALCPPAQPTSLGKGLEAAPGAPGETTAPEGPASIAATPPAEKAKPVTLGPRSIAVVGDSLAVGVGMTMEQRLKDYPGTACYPLGKVSTGLISQHFFNWDKRLTELVTQKKITTVVVVMGGNDANNSIGGKTAGSSEWTEGYRQKAEQFLHIAADAGVKVLWVGLPAMRDATYAARVRAVNEAAKQACAAVSGCTYMESGDIFVDKAGKYVRAKKIEGKRVTLRAKDGVHMTMTGYDLLCRQVINHLDQDGELPAPQQPKK